MLQTGQTVGDRFEIEQEIAEGGMGLVYRARDAQTGALVALKVALAHGEQTVRRFLREAALLAGVDHPAVVRHVAHGVLPDGAPWLAMEWLEGVDLQQRLGQGALSVDDAVTVTKRTAEGLQALHRLGLVHRDVKPSNVFLPGGSVAAAKLLDLGTARAAGDVTRLTRSGAIVGTPFYMAPEQARALPDIDARADVFSLGCVLFECLTGGPPFAGGDLLAVLVKILLEPAAPVRERSPEVSPALAALVQHMLAKEPSARPADGDAVLSALDRLGDPDTVTAHVPADALGTAESRVLSIVLARPERGPDALDGDTLPSGETLRHEIAPLGGRVEPLADGSILAWIEGTGLSVDEASRAARIALALAAMAPRARIALVTGRVETSAPLPVGRLVDRAVATLGPVAAIRLDETTAGLLDARFRIDRDPTGPVLTAEHAEPLPARRVLGRVTTLRGRERELANLESLYDECADEPRARAAIVTAPPGGGKTRLRAALLDRLARRPGPPVVWAATADAVGAGSPFGLLGRALRHASGAQEGAAGRTRMADWIAGRLPMEARARVAAFVGELAGVPFEASAFEGLAGTRDDPKRMQDAIRSAWLELVRAQTTRGPLVVVLDDVHWGDAPSLQLVDAALRAEHDRPLFVLAFARPELHERFVALWREREVLEIRLPGLPRSAAAQLVRDVLGADVAVEVVERVVTRAEGNAFFLEELIRAVGASGDGGALPDSVLGILQARLDALGEDAKRALRAASVFGDTFWRGGVKALLGGGEVDALLEELEEREVVERRASARLRGEVELGFRHALVRDAAYAMLTTQDRTLGHRLAGEWLESLGEHDALALAEHAERGGDPQRAVVWLLRAAEQALQGNDVPRALECVERGVRAGARDQTLGALRLVEAAGRTLQGETTAAAEASLQATKLLPPNTAPWFRAVGDAMAAAGRLGDRAALLQWVEEAIRAVAAPDARVAQITCLCRAIVPLSNVGLPLWAPTLAHAEELLASAGPLGPVAEAQLEEARAIARWKEQLPEPATEHFAAACAALERAGDAGNLASGLATLAWSLTQIGDFASARAASQRAIDVGDRIGARGAVAWAQLVEAAGERAQGRFTQAASVLEGLAAEYERQGNVRQYGWAALEWAWALLDGGDAQQALEVSEAAVQRMGTVIPLWVYARAVALAARVRIEPEFARTPAALAMAREIVVKIPDFGIDLYEGFALRVAFETMDAAGAGDEARTGVAKALRDIDARTAGIRRAAWREGYRAIPDTQRLRALARAWGVAPE